MDNDGYWSISNLMGNRQAEINLWLCLIYYFFKSPAFVDSTIYKSHSLISEAAGPPQEGPVELGAQVLLGQCGFT